MAKYYKHKRKKLYYMIKKASGRSKGICVNTSWRESFIKQITFINPEYMFGILNPAPATKEITKGKFIDAYNDATNRLWTIAHP